MDEERPERFSRNRTHIRRPLPPVSELDQLDEELKALGRHYGFDVVDRHWVTIKREHEGT